jgi:hypothetical protein
MTILVDSTKRDPKSEMVLKHQGIGNVQDSFKPIRGINPKKENLSDLALFIVNQLEGTYIGGFLNRKNNVRIEGKMGSHPYAGNKMFGVPEDARAVCPGWLFPVFKPHFDETLYFIAEAEKIRKLAGMGGRVIIFGNVFDIIDFG